MDALIRSQADLFQHMVENRSLRLEYYDTKWSKPCWWLVDEEKDIVTIVHGAAAKALIRRNLIELVRKKNDVAIYALRKPETRGETG